MIGDVIVCGDKENIDFLGSRERAGGRSAESEIGESEA